MLVGVSVYPVPFFILSRTIIVFFRQRLLFYYNFDKMKKYLDFVEH